MEEVIDDKKIAIDDSNKIEAQTLPDTQTKVKKIIKKTNEIAINSKSSTTQSQTQTQTRDRAKVSNTKVDLFSNKQQSSNINGRKESKPVLTIGNEGFKNRLSIFEKSNKDTVTSKEDPGPKKLDMSKFNFGGDNNSKTNLNPTNNASGVSWGIQARLNAYLDNARNRSKTVAHIEPIVSRIKESKMEEDNQKLETEENNINNSSDELNISGGEEEKKNETELNLEEDDKKEKAIEMVKKEDDIGLINDETKIIEVAKEG